jgi:poly(3-hydroxybutyrate) depolymerase
MSVSMMTMNGRSCRPCIRRLIWSIVILASWLVGRETPAAEDRPLDSFDELHMREALVLPPVGRYGRAPFHIDPIQAELAAGTWTAPDAGDGVESPDGSTQSWRKAEAGEDGWLRDRALRGGYVYWSVDSPRERIMILEASGHSIAHVNGIPRAGDPYRTGWLSMPVRLRAGRNDLLFRVSRGRMRATLRTPPSEAFIATRDATMPDLITGEDWSTVGGIVVVNATERAMSNLMISAGGSGLPTRETALPNIGPMTFRKVPFHFGGPLPPGTPSCEVRLELTRIEDGRLAVLDTATVTARVRGTNDIHKRTFISAMDGSVQYYAVTPMRRADGSEATDQRRPALYLTLHGAGVEAIGQARVYAPKESGYVVAPTNRRPFGFDWEDWGRLDAMEVLEIASKRYDIDPRRTYLTGHSMGGHGTWHLGVTFPARFAAIGPSAGWISFWSYAGAAEYEDPTSIERILRRAADPSDTLALARNLIPLGVYILHGEKDDNVPVEQARIMRDHLEEFHDDVAYHEEPGAGHWWGNRCCDWPPMFEFFSEHQRPMPEDIDHIGYYTMSPGVSASCDWITIEQQIRCLDLSSVTADVDRAARRITIRTDNIARLSVDGSPIGPGRPIEVMIDGKAIAADMSVGDDARIILTRDPSDSDGGWRRTGDALDPSQKGPQRYGLFKDAFRHRMLFVYATQGTAEENAWASAKARFDAETFAYRGNGSIDVIPDTAFDADAMRDRSVILYGHAEANAAWDALIADSPIQAKRGVIRVGEREIRGDDRGCLFIRPRPDSATASVGVVAGSGVLGMRLTDGLPYFVSGVAYPDFIVFGPEIHKPGAAGVDVAGFFGMDWSIEAGEAAWRSR